MPDMTSTPRLEISDLVVTYRPAGAEVKALRGVSLQLAGSRTVGVIGESGAGKTTLALSTLMLLPADSSISGSVRVNGTELVGASEQTLRTVRGLEVGLMLQAAGTSLNPVRTVGSQLTETLRLRVGTGRTAATAHAHDVAVRVGLGVGHLARYPHQLSGGERQRAMLALALACEPGLIVLDEPTAGLDTEARAAFLQLVSELRRDEHAAFLIVTHDLAAVAEVADEALVLYAGIVIERGEAREVLNSPRHPYTRDLVASYPSMTTQKDLRAIRGMPPDSANPPAGCPYHPRCTQALDACSTWQPHLEATAGREIACVRGGVVTMLEADGVSKAYPGAHHDTVDAVVDASISVHAGEVVGVVGETGSGKSTLARLLLGIEPPDSGHVLWEGQNIATLSKTERGRFRREASMVFQDPYEAVSPRFTVAETVREPLDVHGAGTSEDRERRCAAALESVGLSTSRLFHQRLAHELSGGELQRVAVARALVLEPRILVADEATAQLDASEQARLLILLKDLQTRLGIALIVISHDLALVRKVADRIAVMHAGRIIEEGRSDRLLTRPTAEYTRRLITAAPHFD